MVIYHMLNIQHNLRIPPMGHLGHLFNCVLARFKDASWLRMQHEWHSEEAFDPF